MVRTGRPRKEVAPKTDKRKKTANLLDPVDINQTVATKCCDSKCLIKNITVDFLTQQRQIFASKRQTEQKQYLVDLMRFNNGPNINGQPFCVVGYCSLFVLFVCFVLFCLFVCFVCFVLFVCLFVCFILFYFVLIFCYFVLEKLFSLAALWIYCISINTYSCEWHWCVSFCCVYGDILFKHNTKGFFPCFLSICLFSLSFFFVFLSFYYYFFIFLFLSFCLFIFFSLFNYSKN